MEYNSKNYLKQGGDVWVIGGTLEILPEATITGLPVAENQANSTATDTVDIVADFNALLAKLKAAGLMAAD